jgi:hypothetical protein
MNTRHFFSVGLILVLLGVQLRAVETFVLNQKASDFLEKRMRSKLIRSEGMYDHTQMYVTPGPSIRKQWTHPRWVGLAFISVGAVLVLQGVSRRSD